MRSKEWAISASTLDELAEAFWKRVDRSGPDDCWPWQLALDRNGYGASWELPARSILTWKPRDSWLPHRLAWFLIYGPIPPGWTIDHRCRVRRCCNPKHLRLRTRSDNCSDNGWSGRGECKNGHRLDADNVAFYRGNRGRVCKQCRRARR